MYEELFQKLGLRERNSGVCHAGWIEGPRGEELISINPATGEPIARVIMGSADDYDRAVEVASETFRSWQMVPAPRRGEVVRQIGQVLRERKKDLGWLVTLETGK